jgi:hypothetical protein
MSRGPRIRTQLVILVVTLAAPKALFDTITLNVTAPAFNDF